MITVVHRHKCVTTEQKPNLVVKLCPPLAVSDVIVHVRICWGELLATNIQSENKVSLRCIKNWMNTKNTFHTISLRRKMIWVFDVIADHFSTGHTHCPTQSHAHMLYFRLLLPCVPRFSEGVADLQKERTCLQTNCSTCCYEWSVGGLAVQ